MKRRTLAALGVALAWLPLWQPAHAQQAGLLPRADDAWLLDRVRAPSGSEHRGLIEQEGSGELVFLEIRRPPGRPAYAVRRWFDADRVEVLERLTDAQRQASGRRFERYRLRARIDARLQEQLPLTVEGEGDARRWRYRGPWFHLESTAGEAMTRRAAVRLETLLAALRGIFPPRVEAAPAEDGSSPSAPAIAGGPPNNARGPLRVLLFGSRAEYGRYLARRGLPLTNPAFLSIEENLVVAGSDLNALAADIERAAQRHAAQRRRLEAQQTALPDRLKREREALEKRGASEAEIRALLRKLRTRLQDAIRQQRRDLDIADRKNERLFEERTRETLATLYHEALHAWLLNYVYVGARYDVPRWLNEGLAQVFEAALLEAGTLRVDAPNPRALRSLQADLRQDPLPLAELLAADHRSFLVVHGDGARASARHYAYAWGLAYYLLFQRPMVGASALDRYVQAPPGAAPSPVSRFEQLVGVPLEEFEQTWREYMLELKAAAE